MLTGGCLCGALRYEARGTPFHETLCHCSDCRRAFGAPAIAWFSVRRPEFHWVTGEPATYQSSPGVTRGFCRRCGTSLFYAGDEWPDEIDVATATLDDPGALPPRDHTYERDRLAWLILGDSLPRFGTRRPGGT